MTIFEFPTPWTERLVDTQNIRRWFDSRPRAQQVRISRTQASTVAAPTNNSWNSPFLLRFLRYLRSRCKACRSKSRSSPTRARATPSSALTTSPQKSMADRATGWCCGPRAISTVSHFACFHPLRSASPSIDLAKLLRTRISIPTTSAGTCARTCLGASAAKTMFVGWVPGWCVPLFDVDVNVCVIPIGYQHSCAVGTGCLPPHAQALGRRGRRASTRTDHPGSQGRRPRHHRRCGAARRHCHSPHSLRSGKSWNLRRNLPTPTQAHRFEYCIPIRTSWRLSPTALAYVRARNGLLRMTAITSAGTTHIGSAAVSSSG